MLKKRAKIEQIDSFPLPDIIEDQWYYTINGLVEQMTERVLKHNVPLTKTVNITFDDSTGVVTKMFATLTCARPLPKKK